MKNQYKGTSYSSTELNRDRGKESKWYQDNGIVTEWYRITGIHTELTQTSGKTSLLLLCVSVLSVLDF
jgi:hypothetical protein